MTPAENGARIRLFDPTDPRFLADPYPAYAVLRKHAPVWRAPNGELMLSRHADVTAVLKDVRFGHDFEGKLSYGPGELRHQPVFQNMRLWMLVRDPPDHTRIRGLLAKAFTARRLEALRAKITMLVEELLDSIEPEGRMEVIADFARPLTVLVICELLGIPPHDRPHFLADYRFSSRPLDPIPMTREELDAANANALHNRRSFEELFDRWRDTQGEGLINAMLHAYREQDGRLSYYELLANVDLLFAAGHETTMHLIGNGLLALHRNPEQWQKLVSDPRLASSTVDELLRFDSPVQLAQRKAFENVVLASGTLVRRGEIAYCLIGATNRDPAVYSDPDKLDITRTDIRPLSFGGGIHRCLGAQLARIEGEIAFRRLAERLPALQLEDIERPSWQATITLRGLTSLYATW